MSKPSFTPEELALFEADQAEAEHGYTAEYIRSCRDLGRPLTIGQETAQVMPFRLDPPRARRLAAASTRTGINRSQIIRDGLDRQLDILERQAV